ncbi:riboflavin synthase [candidate division FCPU426 bacterium]|nr:riboflavin synthase [candidate division FCPU426 bacterium]
MNMFTGMIESTGEIRSIHTAGQVVFLDITAVEFLRSGMPRQGDSIAVNGICLTVTGAGGDSFQVQAVLETATTTTLSSWQIGRPVNLERSLTPLSRLDGHLVTGHVDGVAEVESVQSEGMGLKVRLRISEKLHRYIARKGSVALDGVSLTVADSMAPENFTVVLIPHTMGKTILQGVTAGQTVNVEVDIIAKYLERLLRRTGADRQDEGLTLEKLRNADFAD